MIKNQVKIINGIIIYKKCDYSKNKFFVSHIKDCFNQLSNNKIKINLALVFYEDVNILKTKSLDFAINRTMDYHLTKSFEKSGIMVFNNSTVSELCNNKYKTYLKAKENNINTLPSYFANVNKTTAKPENLQYPLIIKTVDGHGGNEVFLVNNKEDEENALNNLINKNIIYQKYITDDIHLVKDVRFYILGINIICAVERIPKDNSFKSNFSQGGLVKQHLISSEEKDFLNKIITSFNLNQDYIGIDLFITSKGDIFLNEIEDNAGARMAYSCTDLDLIKLYAQYIFNKLNK